jgi:hypothetical protein
MMWARFRSTLSILSALSLSLILASPDALAAQHGRTSVTIRNAPPRPMTPGSQLWVQHLHQGKSISRADRPTRTPSLPRDRTRRFGGRRFQFPGGTPAVRSKSRRLLDSLPS